jgi:hypothetical protein
VLERLCARMKSSCQYAFGIKIKAICYTGFVIFVTPTRVALASAGARL